MAHRQALSSYELVLYVMNLTLDIISGNGESLGSDRRKVFGPEGGRIGRAPDCDWVLANPYISRHHATIRWISGTYYIESAGENGVAIGSPQGLIPKLERRPLHHGDRLFIDEYEICVGLEGAAAQAVATPHGEWDARPLIPSDDPFDLRPRDLVPAAGGPLGASADELDPLRHLGGSGNVRVNTPPAQEAHWNHTPGVSDHFSAPRPSPSTANLVQPVIPDDWNVTTFGRAKPAPSAAREGGAVPIQPAPSSPAASSAIPDDWDKTSFSRKAAVGPEPRPPIRPTPASSGGAAVPQPPIPAAAATAGTGGSTPVSATAAPRAAAGPPAVSEPQGFDVIALLRAAGVDPGALPADAPAALGQILRCVVQGVIEVLRARTEIKEQFRLTQTVVKTAENNPLKFAADANDALASLLGRRNPAYLPAVEAFEDAFDDIRYHQLAMLAGMRAGFEQVLGRFDPQQLQDAFDKRARRGSLLAVNAKARYWEQFVQEFQELAQDRERAFRQLFAEEFAVAYERQLEELKRNHSKSRR